MNYTDGIILAGGRGTRLGPLAAQISKALVSVGNRPQVVNQIMQLRDAGCNSVIVVTSPDTNTQVSDAIVRAGLGGIARTVVQPKPNGPVDALTYGLNATYATSIILLFSDASFTEQLPNTGDWVGVSHNYDPLRPWCYMLNNGSFIDGRPLQDHPVTIGAYRFADAARARASAQSVLHDGTIVGEVGMAPFLNSYAPESRQEFAGWTDVGDIFSLAASRHERFITRPFHKLSLDQYGLITKRGVSRDEFEFMLKIGARDAATQTLFPTVYDMDEKNMTYTMDFIDMPTLAELWLYWPGLPETWQRITYNLIDRLQWTLWKEVEVPVREPAGKWMAAKAMRRLQEYAKQRPMEQVNIPVKMLADAADIIGDDIVITGHGDLNFTNILYSLSTGTFKLVDPRGGTVPLIYEYAKLGYSHDFASITHGLIDDECRPLPSRQAEQLAVNSALWVNYDPQRLYAAQGLIALAAPPLHVGKEATALYNLGMEYMRRAGL